jgi:hypothetical protein
MRSFRTYFVSYSVKVAQSPVLTIHCLLKLQNVYILYGTFGNWFRLVDVNLFHRIWTVFD